MDGNGMTRAMTGARTGAGPAARLVCTDLTQLDDGKAREIRIAGDREHAIGRDQTCDIHVNSRQLSRRHARIARRDDAWNIEDLKSTNGVFVNDRRVESAVLRHGDRVRFGPVPFRFEVDGAAPLAAGGGRRSGWLAPVLLLLLLVAGGMAGFLLLRPAEDDAVAALLAESTPVVEQALARVAGLGPDDPLGADVADDADALAELSIRAERLLATHPAEPRLVELLAGTGFMAFERAFVPVVEAGRMEEAEVMARAFTERLETVARPLPPETVPGRLAAVLQLARAGQGILSIRSFTLVFPEIGPGPAPPPVMLDLLAEASGKLAEARQSHATLLANRYLPFGRLVDRIEAHDVPLLRAWQDFVRDN